MRPLSLIGNTLSNFARNGNIQPTTRIKRVIDNIGIALKWTSHGYQYDNRTFWQRITDKNAVYYWKQSVKVLLT